MSLIEGHYNESIYILLCCPVIYDRFIDLKNEHVGDFIKQLNES